MAAPIKNVLNYYNWECNAFDNDMALKKLSMKYGPQGETVYRRMLDLIYSNGFFLEIDLDDLVMILVYNIGSKWINESKVVEILMYCADIGLFEKNLVNKTIWTSYGIQKRYFEIMVKLRRTIKIEKNEYLLYEDVLSAPNYGVIDTLTGVIATFTQDNAPLTPVIADKRKEKEIKLKEIKEKNILEELLGNLVIVFNDYLGKISAQDMLIIQTRLIDYSFNDIMDAIGVAKKNKVKNIDYVLGILKKNS